MKANELMIGDWVNYDPNVFNDDEYLPREPLKKIKLARGEDIDLAEEHCYSPIPLTEEILKANGWETYHYASEEFDENRYRHLAAIFSLSIERDHYSIMNGDYGFANITYVHELQHALRLCDLNDLADNFELE